MVRIGIIGTGNMGRMHAAAYKEMSCVRLTTCYDTVAERAAKYKQDYGVEHLAASAEEAFERCDAVVIATPDRSHASLTIKALSSGKHVLCEKPLTCTLAEARDVAAAARTASGKHQIHMIDFSYRRSAAAQEAMRLARKGALGEIRHVHSSYLQSWIPCRPEWGGEDWRAPYLLWKLCTCEGSGGVLNDVGCHLLDLTTACSEDLSAIRCDLRSYPKPLDGKTCTSYEGRKLDANDTAVIQLQFLSGGIGLAHTTRWATGYSNTIHIEVHGSEGAIRFDLDQSYEALDFCIGDARHHAKWERQVLPAAPSVFERFVKAVQTGRQDQPDILRGAQVQAYMEAAFRSAGSGAWESIPCWQ